MKHIIIWLAALAAIACGLLMYEGDMLWKVQELNLFLNTSLFFKQQMVVAGGMLTYVGTWFTQFFHYPWIGVTMLCGWWLLLLWLLKRTFNVPARWASLLLIPVALLLLTDVDLGYWIYFLKLKGHFFISTIGTTAVVALLWGFRSLPDKHWLRALWMVLTCAIGYPLLGIYGLAATLLMGIWSWRLTSRSRSVVYTVIAALSVIAVPLLCYRYVYYEMNLANIYYAKLPLFFITEEYQTYYIPYYLLALSMIVLCIAPLKSPRRGEESHPHPLESPRRGEELQPQPLKVSQSAPIQKEEETNEPVVKNRKDTPHSQVMYSQRKKTKDAQHTKAKDAQRSKVKDVQQTKPKEHQPKKKNVIRGQKWAWLAQAAVLAVTVWGVVHFWYKDENFHHELRMQHLINQTDWDGVVQDAKTQQDEPTRAIVMMRNLALSRLGRQANEMYHFKNGSKKYNAPFDMRMMIVAGTLIYYQYGMLNYCTRLCTELGVEFDWSPEYYKYLIRCALLNGEKKVARKYINILKNTLYFGEWAEWAENLLEHPDQIAQEREIEPITHMLHYPNVLSSDQGYVESFLMKQLARSSYPEDPVYQEQSLLASLWLKESDVFWYHFGIYANQHQNSPMPITYQEAAYLYGQKDNRPDLDQMPFNQSVKDNFDRFMSTSANYEGMDIEDARERLYPLFGNTYYYDYFLMSNLPEY